MTGKDGDRYRCWCVDAVAFSASHVDGLIVRFVAGHKRETQTERRAGEVTLGVCHTPDGGCWDILVTTEVRDATLDDLEAALGARAAPSMLSRYVREAGEIWSAAHQARRGDLAATISAKPRKMQKPLGQIRQRTP